MLLTIDAGNTNILFALYQGDQRRGSWRIATDARRTGDEYAVWLTHLMGLVGVVPGQISDAILASVVPAATGHLEDLCRVHFGLAPMVVGAAGVDSGIEIAMPVPEEVGVDRIVNAVAARALVSLPAVIIDIGTATTFDVVDRQGRYIGGVIAPGPQPSMEALHRLAAKLPRIDIIAPERAIGNSTVTAMQSGFYWGYVGLINGILDRITDDLGTAPSIIATGGLAGLFAGQVKRIQRVEPDLTLNGLRDIFLRNRPVPTQTA